MLFVLSAVYIYVIVRNEWNSLLYFYIIVMNVLSKFEMFAIIRTLYVLFILRIRYKNYRQFKVQVVFVTKPFALVRRKFVSYARL